MNIIEKLGIRIIPRYTALDIFEDNDKYEMCLDKDVKELEQQRNELLEDLINAVLSLENEGVFFTGQYNEIIESYDRQKRTWEQIKKELLK